MLKVGNENAYDVQEVSKMFNTSAQTVRLYIKQGKLTSQRIGRRLYITENSLEAFLRGDKKAYED